VDILKVGDVMLDAALDSRPDFSMDLYGGGKAAERIVEWMFNNREYRTHWFDRGFNSMAG